MFGTCGVDYSDSCLVSDGVLTRKNGRKVMFLIGFLVPVVWIVGAILSKPAPS